MLRDDVAGALYLRRDFHCCKTLCGLMDGQVFIISSVL